jgi:uroporphyrinogen-III decarboxylase
VYAALRREPADRVAIYMWFHPGTRRLLAELFEVPPAYVDEVLGNDVRMTWVNNNYYMEGIDVLNPVQCNCPGMDAAELKREFGSALTFMGGVDTQRLLPVATADEVRRATRNLIDRMTADGGGYILAASHTIPPETPVENIFAMYQEAGISREDAFDRAAGIRQHRVNGVSR